jgi:diguanylate cyclase (GGDEF)-like protein/PAS domain S-box-containing protein
MKRVRLSALALLLTRDRVLLERLAQSFPDPAVDALVIEHVERLADATRRLKAADDVQAVIVDWDLPDTKVFEAFLTLIAAAPHLPILVVGADTNLLQQMNLVEHGAQEYLLKSRLDGDLLASVVHSSIARKSREEILYSDKERAQITLNSIGDAVLSTDGDWRITFLNPVAERMIGWPYIEAAGRHLSEVFHVIDGVTRERITPQLQVEIKKGRTMILPPNCVLVRRDGHESPIEDSAAPIHDRTGRVSGMVVVFHDVSDTRAMTQRMIHLAQHDTLTALPNRALLDDRLDQGITLAHLQGRQLAVLFVDLDHFKHINDSVGHLIGDQLLKAVSQRIVPCVRGCDTVSRPGGDEFIVLLSEVQHPDDAARIAESIRVAVLEPYHIANHYLQLTTSIGVSVYPDDAEDAETLIQSADTAMYHAKERGRNNVQFFQHHMNIRAIERQIITGDLRHALARGEFLLEYQPKINLVSGAITGVEALIRWRHPNRGLLAPIRFIPYAEDCGLIIQIGEWALREACAQAQSWIAAGLKFGTMAVNISAVEFRSDRFFEGVRRVLQSTGLEPRYLELELTETAVMRSFEATCRVLEALRDMGVRIAVDDFGTGYSNLSYLRRFPIDTLKLDGSFVHDLPGSADVATIVSSVISMAHSLHLQVVAEGVENAQQLQFLQQHDCGEGQGHYFSKPVDSTVCRSLLSLAERNWAGQFRAPALRALT